MSLDDERIILTPVIAYHPVNGEELPINAPGSLMRAILLALIDDGVSSKIAKDIAIGKFMNTDFGNDRK